MYKIQCGSIVRELYCICVDWLLNIIHDPSIRFLLWPCCLLKILGHNYLTVRSSHKNQFGSIIQVAHNDRLQNANLLIGSFTLDKKIYKSESDVFWCMMHWRCSIVIGGSWGLEVRTSGPSHIESDFYHVISPLDWMTELTPVMSQLSSQKSWLDKMKRQ